MAKIFVYEYLTGGGIDPALACQGSIADLSALIGEGRMMRNALVASLASIDGVSVTFASSRFEAFDRAAAHYRPNAGEAIPAFVARMAREHDYAWVIAPECDGLLGQLHDAVGAERWLGCTKEAIRIASSKSATSARLAARGIATTEALDPLNPLNCAGPGDGRWVVKPDDGAGSLDTFVFDSYAAACADYQRRLAAGGRPVLQAWVEGEPLSLSLVCREGDAELVSVNRQRIDLIERHAPGTQMRVVEFSGVLVDAIDLDSPRGRTLATLAKRVAAAIPGLRGFVGVDLVWHPERGPVVVEINPRLTVAYAGLVAEDDGRARRLTEALLAAHGVRLARSAPSGYFAMRAACGVAS
ncbi:peptidase [Trinickia symbiotica]|uniref:Peptidase n=1 Tax=Trinickia symbiotica TaxID=863227 RepID=A0A2T3Y0A7_9BURK|nr:ATP-grasp domain-containing protein [Trinickia symbiotica]PTB22207.1 peptidase [Trinickia symbiotica]